MAILGEQEAARVRELFAGLERPVELLVALGPEQTPMPGAGDVDFGAEAVRIAEGLAELSAGSVAGEAGDARPEDRAPLARPGELVSVRVEHEPEGFPRFPAIAIRPEGRDAGLRYDGLPWGYELGSLIGAILEAGKPQPQLRPETREALAALDRDLALDVFVTPT